MSAAVEGKKEDLGAILARVQDDLQQIRTAVAGAGDAVDLATLESLLSRTERGVQVASRQVLSSSLDHVTTLPPLYHQQHHQGEREREREGVPERRRRRRRGRSEGLLEMAERSSRQSPISQARQHHPLTVAEENQMMQRARLVSRPSLPATRNQLSQEYSLPLTSDGRLPTRSKVKGRVHTGGTVPPLTTLPQQQKNNATVDPAIISEDEVQRGILSLIERQLIPPAADIILDPPAVKSRTLELLSSSQQYTRPTIASVEDGCGHMVGVKLAPDNLMTSCNNEPRQQATPTTVQTSRPPHLNVQVIPVPDPLNQFPEQSTVASVSPVPYSTHIVIENGRTITDSPEYKKFHSSNSEKWNNILAVLGLLEEMCMNYAIPTATVKCDRVVELGLENELGLRIGRHELLSSLVNCREMATIISTPGQRFKGKDGRNAAAALIQATYLMYCQRRRYCIHLRRKWAVNVISNAWTLYTARQSVRKRLRERRERELKGHRSKTSQLGKSWRQIREGKRVIIHLPSLGHPLWVRGTETEIRMEQSLQLARITDVLDPDVEVVYISPVPLSQEVLDHYSELMALSPSQSARERVHIVTPDLSLPPHPLSLSTLLTHNPRTVQRIKRLTAGREAYIIPGVTNPDDLTISDMLGVPLLGSDSDVSELYGSKDGARLLFSESHVATPPYVSDVVSEAQLVEQLTTLVASYPLIRRWVFKLPRHTRGRGFAYCDVADHLQCHEWLVRESERYGDKWSTKWAQEGARRRIILELPRILESQAKPVNSDLYPSWRAFLADFLINGGLIEGHPPSPSVTSVTVELFIDPTGDVSVLGTYDQISEGDYMVWGASLPQTSVPPDLLKNTATKVGVACSGRGLLGHLSVDFVTFINPKTLEQELWAVDLDLGYSNHLALLRLLGYVTGATVDPGSGQLMVDSGPRFAVLSARVYHSSLPLVHYPVFFQMCKANRIGYDAKEKVGTLFALFDSEHKENIGIICLQSSLGSALSSCSSTLSTLHQELSSPNIEGHTNFKGVCKELEMVAELVKDNANVLN